MLSLFKKNNPDIQAAEDSVRSSLFLVHGAQGSYYPQISGNLSYSKIGPSENVGVSAGADSYGASLNLTQNLFNGFADISKVDQYQAQVRVAESQLQVTKAKVSYDLKTSIARFLYAKEIEKAVKGFLKRREENLRMVELRFASGRENKGSLYLAQAYLKQAKSDITKAKNARTNSLSEFKKVLGLNEVDTVDGPEIDVLDEIPLNLPSEKEPDFKLLALQTPDRKQYLAQIDSSMATLKIAKAGYLPVLNLTGSIGKSDTSFSGKRSLVCGGANDLVFIWRWERLLFC